MLAKEVSHRGTGKHLLNDFGTSFVAKFISQWLRVVIGEKFAGFHR